MTDWLKRRLRINPGEGGVTLLMFLYIFCTLGFYYILKPLRAGLFLSKFSPEQLPYAYFLTAILAGTIATLVMKLSRRISVIGFITGTNAAIIVTLIWFRWALGRDFAALPYVYYVYVQIVSVLSTSQFWLLAGQVYDNRQAKRIFPLLGAGAIAGAMTGSFITGYKLESIGVNRLLIVCAVTCALLIVLGRASWRRRRQQTETAPAAALEEPKDDLRSMLHTVTGSRHISMLVLLIFLALIASQISEWQVNAAADEWYGSQLLDRVYVLPAARAAFARISANAGKLRIDRQTLVPFEQDLERNLDRILLSERRNRAAPRPRDKSRASAVTIESALAEELNRTYDRAKQDAINGMWGRFNFWTNLLGIILQVGFTAAIIRRFGIGTAILFMPAAMLIASGGIVAWPVLWAALLGQGSNSIFRYSINRVGLELLYLPLSSEMRKRIKVFCDVFIDRLGRAIAGVIILSLPAGGLRGTALATFAICLVSIVVCVRLRDTYVQSFRQKLARREMDLSEIERYVTDPATLGLLVRALEGNQERQILYALHLLQSSRGTDFSAQLLLLLRHGSPYVRAEAVRTLPSLPRASLVEAERLLSDPDDAVRQAAVDYLCTQDHADAKGRLASLLGHPDPRIRLSALRCMSECAEVASRPTREQVRSLIAAEGPRSREEQEVAAGLAAHLPAAESVPLLRSLLASADVGVVAAAARAAGKSEHADLIFDLVPMLARRKLRRAVREGLARFGPRIAGTLGDILRDPKRDIAVRMEIPAVLGQFDDVRAAEALIENLTTDNPHLKYEVIRGLNRIHARNPALPGIRPEIAERVYMETRGYYEALALLQSVTDGGHGLLQAALRERLDRDLEVIFRLLGLQYSQKDIFFAYSALRSTQADRRASAVEFLDNVLSKNLKSLIVPLLEESSPARLIEHASRQFGIRTPGRETALRSIMEQPDSWLRACAAHEIGRAGLASLAHMCRKAAGDGDPVVRESAEWALRRIT